MFFDAGRMETTIVIGPPIIVRIYRKIFVQFSLPNDSISESHG